MLLDELLKAPTGSDDPVPAQPLLEVLPERDGKRNAIRWFAATDDHTPQAGFVVIDTPDASTCYVVTEFPTVWPGRGFYLRKWVSRSGRDKDVEAYSVLCAKAGARADTCECRGFVRWSHCKHADAMRALVENRWV